MINLIVHALKAQEAQDIKAMRHRMRMNMLDLKHLK